MKAVPEEWACAAKADFNWWQNDSLGHYAVKNSVSRDKVEDEFNLALGMAPSAEEMIVTTKNLEELINCVRTKLMRIIELSPKHGLAMVLSGLGFKGERFAGEMRLSKPAALHVREQVRNIVPNGIDSFDKVDVERIKTSRSSKDQYYKDRALDLLDTLLIEYFQP